ncbi:MAG: ribosome small subunit-dependent GTPase A [Thermomicrobiales bacterium]|nr:ribosome small subunit-dependent GTPase A [Thermomicrobiales bacterium]
MQSHNLHLWGATERQLTESASQPHLHLARVITQERGQYTVVTESGERTAMLSGKFLYATEDISTLPAVGDWILLAGDDDMGVVQQVLPRTSLIARKAVGMPPRPQVIAANVDIVFICMAMNANFNLSRLERYLAVVWESNAKPVVVLTKADLAPDLEHQIERAESVAIGVDIVTTSATEHTGFERLRQYLGTGVTIAFIGSSGVGKSTLVNTLVGSEVLKTSHLRNDDQGRHTTTHREAILLPGGGVLIDTPGMRELGIESADVDRTFADIEELAVSCRFNDCTHHSEPGCAVRAAVETGDLDHRRLESYRKLSNEVGYAGKSSRQIGEQKLNRIFGGRSGAKAARKQFKEKERLRSG